MRRRAWLVLSLLVIFGVLGSPPAQSQRVVHSSAVEKMLESFWFVLYGQTSATAPGVLLRGRAKLVEGTSDATYDPVTKITTLARAAAGPCTPGSSTCARRMWQNTGTCDCKMPDGSLPAGTCNVCVCADKCVYVKCAADGALRQLVCPP